MEFTKTAFARSWMSLEREPPDEIIGQFKLVGNVDPDDVLYRFVESNGDKRKSIQGPWFSVDSLGVTNLQVSYDILCHILLQSFQIF